MPSIRFQHCKALRLPGFPLVDDVGVLDLQLLSVDVLWVSPTPTVPEHGYTIDVALMAPAAAARCAWPPRAPRRPVDAPRLPHRRVRRGRDGRRVADGAGDRRRTGHESLTRARAPPRGRRHRRRRLGRPPVRRRQALLARGRHLRHGQQRPSRGGRRAAGARREGAACNRCLGDAHHRLGQHQCHGPGRRRKGLRPPRCRPPSRSARRRRNDASTGRAPPVLTCSPLANMYVTITLCEPLATLSAAETDLPSHP